MGKLVALAMIIIENIFLSLDECLKSIIIDIVFNSFTACFLLMISLNNREYEEISKTGSYNGCERRRKSRSKSIIWMEEKRCIYFYFH